MAQKTPTLWYSNPSKSNGLTAFSDANTAYSSSAQAYSSDNAALNDSGKTATAWTPASKIATIWQANPAATVNQYAYDNALHLFDSALDTYDGVVAGADTLAAKTPTAWSPL